MPGVGGGEDKWKQYNAGDTVTAAIDVAAITVTLILLGVKAKNLSCNLVAWNIPRRYLVAAYISAALCTLFSLVHQSLELPGGWGKNTLGFLINMFFWFAVLPTMFSCLYRYERLAVIPTGSNTYWTIKVLRIISLILMIPVSNLIDAFLIYLSTDETRMVGTGLMLLSSGSNNLIFLVVDATTNCLIVKEVFRKSIKVQHANDTQVKAFKRKLIYFIAFIAVIDIGTLGDFVLDPEIRFATLFLTIHVLATHNFLELIHFGIQILDEKSLNAADGAKPGNNLESKEKEISKISSAEVGSSEA